MLTEKERLDRALHHEEVDRPPCICPGGMMNMVTTDLMDISGITWPEAHTDAEMMAKLALASYEQGCFENVGVPFCMTVEAEAMGAEGIRVTTQEEFKEAFQRARTLGRPVVIDCQIDCDDKVWPMVAPGAAISEAFDEKDLEEKM